jgi:uncharacterized protein (DUF2252 family)
MADVNDTDLINRLQFADQRERELFAKAQLGEQIREWLVTPTGRYVHARAQQEIAQCKTEALECNADNFFGRRKLRKIQARGAAAKNVIAWLADALVEAQHAQHELENYRG